MIGDRVEPGLLREVTAADTAALDEPVAAGLLVADGAVLRFRHEIARRAVEQEVGPHRAAVVHGRILAGLEAAGVADDARLAHHADAALDGPAAVRYARRAADRSAQLASRREAVAQYQRALRFAPADQPLLRAELLDRLGDEQASLDDWTSATVSLEQSIELWHAEGVPVREGDARRRLSYALWRTCRGPEGLATAEAALAVLEPLGTSRELAWALATSASNAMLRENYDVSRAHGHRALDLAAQLELDDVRSDALNTLAMVASWTGGEWYPMLQEALRVALATGHHTQAARAYVNLVDTLIDQVRYPEAERFHREATEFCREHDLATWGLCLGGAHATILLNTGRWETLEAVDGRAPRRRPGLAHQPDHLLGPARAVPGPTGTDRLGGAPGGSPLLGQRARRARVGRAHHVGTRRGALAQRRRRRRSWGSRRRGRGRLDLLEQAAARRSAAVPHRRHPRPGGGRHRWHPAALRRRARASATRGRRGVGRRGPPVRRRDGAAWLRRRAGPARGPRTVRGTRR